MKPILDACCGSRMFWFNKENPMALYMDNRELEDTLCDGRSLQVKPDVVGDFRHMPFENESFRLVVFDPPHLRTQGKILGCQKNMERLGLIGKRISKKVFRNACGS